LDIAAGVKAVQEGKIGPSLNFKQPADGCTLKVTRTLVEKPIRNVLCCGYSFGGQTAAVILKKYEA
jgi:3-oxoacyl-(acyl-carrier-protein) synthase